MNSSDPNSSCELIWQLWAVYIAITFSTAAMVTNGIIVATVLRYHALRSRKEYLIVTGLAFADFVEGTASTMANVYRIILFLNDWACVQLPAYVCMLIPYSWMWRFADYAQTIMLLVISCDRLYAVLVPFGYYKSGKAYAYKVVGGVYTFSAAFMVICSIAPVQYSVTENRYVVAPCFSYTFTDMRLFTFAKITGSIISCVSCIIYGMVVVWHYKQKGDAQAENTSTRDKTEYKNWLKIQRKLTISLGKSSVCTMLFDSVPRVLGIYWTYRPSAQIYGVNYSALVWNGTKINAIANIFIYALNHREIRYAIRHMVSCKSLPHDVKNWKMGQTITPSVAGSKRATSQKKGQVNANHR